MAYLVAIVEFCKPYVIKLVEKLMPILIEDIILDKRKREAKMAEEATALSAEKLNAVTGVVKTVAIVAQSTVEKALKEKMDEELEEFVTKEQTEIATTKNSYVKVRDQLYITLVTAAEAELDAQIPVLGIKALAQLEKLIAKM